MSMAKESSFARRDLRHERREHQPASRPGIHHRFSLVASKVAYAVGTPWGFLLALLVIVTWAVTGPIFGFSDSWQLVINTGTTIVTFLMVFLIQNTQNRDAKATHLKLDELIRAHVKAHNIAIDIEEQDEEVIDREKRKIDVHRDDPDNPGRPRRISR